MDGISFLKEFQEFRQTSSRSVDFQELLIFGMSATAMKDDLQIAYGYGLDGFSKKPVDFKMLRRLLDLKLQRLPVQECVRMVHDEYHVGNPALVAVAVVDADADSQSEMRSLAASHQPQQQQQQQLEFQHKPLVKSVDWSSTTKDTHDNQPRSSSKNDSVTLSSKISDTVVIKSSGSRKGTGLFAPIVSLLFGSDTNDDTSMSATVAVAH